MTIKLLTFRREKYGEQAVAIDVPNSMNLHLFDACELFMTDDTWAERMRVKDEAKEFAEKFVAQMNAGAAP